MFRFVFSHRFRASLHGRQARLLCYRSTTWDWLHISCTSNQRSWCKSQSHDNYHFAAKNSNFHLNQNIYVHTRKDCLVFQLAVGYTLSRLILILAKEYFFLTIFHSLKVDFSFLLGFNFFWLTWFWFYIFLAYNRQVNGRHLPPLLPPQVHQMRLMLLWFASKRPHTFVLIGL